MSARKTMASMGMYSTLQKFIKATNLSKEEALAYLRASKWEFEEAMKMVPSGGTQLGGATTSQVVPNNREADDQEVLTHAKLKDALSDSTGDGAIAISSSRGRSQPEHGQAPAAGMILPDDLSKGSFQEAIRAAQGSSKWLLVYMQSRDNALRINFSHGIWARDNVQGDLNERLILWQEHDHTKEGKKFCQLYKVLQSPAHMVVHPFTFTSTKKWVYPASMEKSILEYLLEDLIPRSPLWCRTRMALSKNGHGKLFSLMQFKKQVQVGVCKEALDLRMWCLTKLLLRWFGIEL